MNTIQNAERRAVALVLLDALIENRKLCEENERLREEINALQLRLGTPVIFPKDTCSGCGGPRGADGLFRHTTPNCPVIGVRNGS
jgi:hypothetical protein